MIMTVANLFRSAKPPHPLKSSPVNPYARWLTWSVEAKRSLGRFRQEAGQLFPPKLIRLHGGLEFDKTYSISREELRGLKCFVELEWMAKVLCSVKPNHSILLFRNLLDDEFMGEHLHKLFSALRSVIVASSGRMSVALHAPLGYVGRKGVCFPLHADLYVPDLLWNVFDQVPSDGSGASTFLSVDTFRQLLQLAHVPLRTKATLLSCLEDNSREDRFRTFYDLLYTQGADWSDRLDSAMRKHQLCVPMQYGEGYMLNDRRWLHGREAPSNGVTEKRVHRLVFSSLSPTSND
jgi:hypothetical protein